MCIMFSLVSSWVFVSVASQPIIMETCNECGVERTVSESAPELCLTMVITCSLLRLLCCCCCAAVVLLLVLFCRTAVAVVLLCIRVRGEILAFVRKRTSAKAFTSDVFLIKNEGTQSILGCLSGLLT